MIHGDETLGQVATTHPEATLVFLKHRLDFCCGGGQKLVDACQKAGIEAAQPGNRLGDVSCAVGDVAREYGYPINLEFGGHGVGHIMHGDPHVPNDGKAHHGYKLRPGLVIAIEPWFLKTTDEIYQDPKDGWTLKSEDGSRGAHSEHTIAITENGPVILTVRD